MRQWFPNTLLSGRILPFFFPYLFLFLFFFSPDGCILINGPPISMDDPPGCFQEVDPIILGLDSADTSGLLDTNCFFPFMVNL